jgi:NADPH2:quinone reductase
VVLYFYLSSSRSLFSSERVKPVIYTEIFPLEELPKGLVALERRETWGKVILHVKDEHSHDGAKL